MIKKRRKYLAFLLTLITPGLGHIYNGQLLSGIIIPVIYISISFVLITISIAKTFTGLVIFLLFVITFYLTIAILAFNKAGSLTQYSLMNFNKIIIYILWPILFFGSDIIITPNNSLSSFSIPTVGMEKTLKVNDMIFADMEFYDGNTIRRNDLVIFNNPEDDKLLVKRVIGLSGEKILMKNGKVYINGKYYQEKNPNIIIDSLSNYSNFDEILIPLKHFFVMGDYREQSTDSRIFRPIDRNLIQGKPLYIYYSSSFDRIGIYLE